LIKKQQMIFIFKKRKLVLDLFTHRQMVFDVAKPKPAPNFYPDWWKELPTSIKLDTEMLPMPTVRRCMGMVDHYKHGFIIPMWTDLRIDLGPIGDSYAQFACSDKVTSVGEHHIAQRGGYLPHTHYQHVKLFNPWLAKCKEDTYFKWEQPTWSCRNPNMAILLPATVEFKYQHSMNTHLMLARSDQKVSLEIPFQQPLVHVTPLTERELDLRYHIVSREEHNKLMQEERPTAINSYRAYRRVRESEEKKCPFGFGRK
jgi:hypothetical protein